MCFFLKKNLKKKPAALDTTFNRTHPAHAILNNEPIQMFLSASPDNFDTPNRAHDGDTLVNSLF